MPRDNIAALVRSTRRAVERKTSRPSTPEPGGRVSVLQLAEEWQVAPLVAVDFLVESGFGVSAPTERLDERRVVAARQRWGQLLARRAAGLSLPNYLSSPRAIRWLPTRDSTVVVDGANVAHADESSARLENISALIKQLRRRGCKALTIVDAALKHRINDPAALNRLISDGLVHEAPAGIDADELVLQGARAANAEIISNDRFLEYRDSFPAEVNRVIGFAVDGETAAFFRRVRREGIENGLDAQTFQE